MIGRITKFTVIIITSLMLGNTALASKPESTESLLIEQLGISHEWQLCSQQSDCALISAGCDGSIKLAVNKKYTEPAKKKLFATHGNPATLNCQQQVPSNPLNFVAMCQESGFCDLVINNR